MKGSRTVFTSPISAISSSSHRWARSIAAELVSRPPITSVMYDSVSGSCDRWSPSSRIFATISRSTGKGSCAAAVVTPKTAAAPAIDARIRYCLMFASDPRRERNARGPADQRRGYFRRPPPQELRALEWVGERVAGRR